MNNNSSTSSGGVGFAGLLTILFIALKLLGYIDWSWWWVLLPIWAPIAILISAYMAAVVFTFIKIKIGL